jgi:hypothetical protein
MRAVLMVALLAGCGATPCEGNEVFCDGDMLVECVDGARVETECAAEGQICHEEMLHCMSP